MRSEIIESLGHRKRFRKKLKIRIALGDCVETNFLYLFLKNLLILKLKDLSLLQMQVIVEPKWVNKSLACCYLFSSLLLFFGFILVLLCFWFLD